MSIKHFYGFHRVIEPSGCIPQAAWRLDNTPSKLHSSEKLVDVEMLNLDSTSMRQLRENYKDIGKRILEIVRERGKMHNPVTNSGGVLMGRYKGKLIIPWASLSAIPLHLEKINRIHGQQVEVAGTAILFKSYRWSAVPKTMDPLMALVAIDVASLVVQVKRLIKNKSGYRILIIGCGTAGVLAMATIKQYAPKAEILGADINGRNFERIRRFGYTNKLAKINAAAPLDVVEFAKDCDLVINCVNVANTEASSVLAAKERGTVIFFSMATQFDKASLAADATGKDVNLIIAAGIANNEDKEIFKLLKINPELISEG